MSHDETSGEDRVVIDQLSSLIDGELSRAELASVEAHLETCVRCRAALAELRAVKTWVSSDVATATDRAAVTAWDELRARLPARHRAVRVGGWRRVSIAASLLLAGVASATWWTTRDRGSSIPPANTAVASGAEPPPAVAGLETIAHARLAVLPAPKSLALQASLQILDGAIADARAASASDPDNEFVATYLDVLLKRKADALRKIVEMADAERTS